MTVTNAQRLAESAAEQKLKETQFEYIREVLLRLPTDCDITHWLQVNAVNDLDTLLGLSHTLIATMTHRVPDPDDTTKKISVTLIRGGDICKKIFHLQINTSHTGTLSPCHVGFFCTRAPNILEYVCSPAGTRFDLIPT
jgi:hypothetical protein